MASQTSSSMSRRTSKLCRCHPPMLVVTRISATKKNPGRPFIACERIGSGTCGFFEWIETPKSEVQNQIVECNNERGSGQLSSSDLLKIWCQILCFLCIIMFILIIMLLKELTNCNRCV